jgi:Bifunctional DNA primase/polymerase, N-terminal
MRALSRGDEGSPVTARERPEAAAHRYAAHGWPVFPCRFDSKEPATERGFLDATTDHERIDFWWRKDPERPVAIATGAPGPDVLDVDVHNGAPGWRSYNQLRAAGLVPDAMAEIRTPSGGGHFYYRGTDQRNGKLVTRVDGKPVSLGIDYRGAGGYVVAPPSQVGGRPYEVVSKQASAATFDWSAARQLLSPAPERKAFEHSPDRPRSLDHLARHVASLQEGNRNDGTYWAMCRAAEAGDRGALAAVADAARSIGLTDREISASVRSAERTTGRSGESQAEPRPFEPAAQLDEPALQREAEAG